VLLVPPGEVGDLGDRQQLVERAQRLAAQLRPSLIDDLVALRLGGDEAGVEVVAFLGGDEVGELAQRRRVVLDP